VEHLDRQGLKVLLSHHRADQLHLCYRVPGTGLCLCARCVGLYPGMALALVLGRLTGPWPWWLEWGLLFIAPLPALVEWGLTAATGRPERANWIRSLTGAGLGLGLGADLVHNTRDLLGYPVMAQLLMFLVFIWFIWMVSYSRRSGVRRQALRKRLARPSLQEFVLGPAEPGAGQDPKAPDKPQTR